VQELTHLIVFFGQIIPEVCHAGNLASNKFFTLETNYAQKGMSVIEKV